MKIPSQQLVDLEFTYRQICEVILYILEVECESLEDFLIDYKLYMSTEAYISNRGETMQNWLLIECRSSDFRQIKDIAHAIILDSKSPMLISEFLQETFRRFAQIRDKKQSAGSLKTKKTVK